MFVFITYVHFTLISITDLPPTLPSPFLQYCWLCPSAPLSHSGKNSYNSLFYIPAAAVSTDISCAGNVWWQRYVEVFSDPGSVCQYGRREAPYRIYTRKTSTVWPGYIICTLDSTTWIFYLEYRQCVGDILSKPRDGDMLSKTSTVRLGYII